jgi:hypothetical protein
MPRAKGALGGDLNEVLGNIGLAAERQSKPLEVRQERNDILDK